MAIAVRVRVPPSAPVRKSKGHGDVRDPFLLLFSCRGAGPPVPCVSCPAREAGDKAKGSPRALHCRPPPAYHSPSAGRLDVPTASRPVKAATSLFPCPAPLLFPPRRGRHGVHAGTLRRVLPFPRTARKGGLGKPAALRFTPYGLSSRGKNAVFPLASGRAATFAVVSPPRLLPFPKAKGFLRLTRLAPVSNLLFRSALERTQRELDPEEVFQRSFFCPHGSGRPRCPPGVWNAFFAACVGGATCGNAHPPEAAGGKDRPSGHAPPRARCGPPGKLSLTLPSGTNKFFIQARQRSGKAPEPLGCIARIGYRELYIFCSQTAASALRSRNRFPSASAADISPPAARRCVRRARQAFRRPVVGGEGIDGGVCGLYGSPPWNELWKIVQPRKAMPRHRRPNGEFGVPRSRGNHGGACRLFPYGRS